MYVCFFHITLIWFSKMDSVIFYQGTGYTFPQFFVNIMLHAHVLFHIHIVVGSLVLCHLFAMSS